MNKHKTTLSIDGKMIDSFESVRLHQTINNHHTFTIAVKQEVIEETGQHTIEASREWLGKSIVICFGENDEQQFLGTITNISFQHNDGHHGQIILSGFSKTILLDSGEQYRSWMKKSLKDIAKEVVGTVNLDANPSHTSPLNYQCQYKETNFSFLQRLAKQYNEWFYYDGEYIVFGKPAQQEEIPLEYGKDLTEINVSIQAKPTQSTMFSYNSLDDKQTLSYSKGEVKSLSELGQFAYSKSNELFATPSIQYSSARVENKNDMDIHLQNQEEATASMLNTISGNSSKQGIGVGSVIKLSSAKYDDKAYDTQPYGSYLITSITHHATGNEQYSNTFVAVPSGVKNLPAPQVNIPLASEQIATVLSNEDPEQKGRIQVQFQWQIDNMKTEWLRVMTPDAGKSELVGTNRGFVFIPEEGDTVMVGFRYGDPNRPYVMGSMFNGLTGAGGNEVNKMKSITTRSGATITINDDEGKGQIVFSDPTGSTITLNGDETITVTAPKKISFLSEEVSIEAQKNMTLNAGENMNVSAKGDATFLAEGNVTTQSQGDTEVKSAGNLTLEATSDASLLGMNAIVEGKTNAELNGTQAKLTACLLYTSDAADD